MGDSTSLVSFGDWPKPVDTLIVKISDALGGLYRPLPDTESCPS